MKRIKYITIIISLVFILALLQAQQDWINNFKGSFIRQELRNITKSAPSYDARYNGSFNVKSLEVETKPSLGIKSVKFLSKVGGIAFEKIAKPNDNLKDVNISLYYDKTAIDGERLNAILIKDGVKENIIVPIFDWELIPILNYTNSIYYSCFSLFGEVSSLIRDAEIKKKNNIRFFAAYHTAFNNTLVGLRLFQMDSFGAASYKFWELPRDKKGNIIFGTGEIETRTQELFEENFEKFINFFKKNKNFQAYVIIDDPNDIIFEVFNKKLIINGKFYVYFWEINKNIDEDKLKNYIEFNGVNLENINPEELIDFMEPIHLKQMSDELYENSDIIKNTNPYVYNSTNNVMKYSAFFRYIKIKNPDNWSILLNETKNIPIQPMVITPNVVYNSQKITNLYYVKKNDYLRTIARKYYNDEKMWIKIYKENKRKIENPDIIYPNQKLTIPQQ